MLSMAGMQLVRYAISVNQARLRAVQYHHLQDTEMPVDGEEGPPQQDTLSKTIVLSFVFHLRNHLKALYGVTDQ